MDLKDSVAIATSGLNAQSKRVRVTSENLANANTTAKTAGGEPYRRKTITFKNELDRASGTYRVKVNKIKDDTASELGMKYDPSHPAAEARFSVDEPRRAA